MDGRLDEKVWSKANDLEMKLAVLNRTDPICATTAKLLYDKNNFYIAVECDEKNINDIKALVKVRDELVFKDDCIEVFS